MLSFALALVDAVGYCPYTRQLGKRYRAVKSELGGVSGIDILLGNAAVSEGYPANTMDKLRTLVTEVEHAENLTSIARARVIYYILLDYPEDDTAGESVAAHYAKEIQLNAAQQNFARGLWSLDRGDAKAAFLELGEPWDRDVPEDLIVARANKWILRAFAKTPKLLVAYVESKQPLRDEDDTRLFVDALIECGLFAKVLELAQETHSTAILRILATSVLKTQNRDAALRLVSLAFSRDEWDTVQSVLDPEIAENASGLAGELTLVRALHVGDLLQIHRMKKLSPQNALLTQGIAEL